MNIFIYLLIAFAVAAIIYSIALTVKLFKCFGESMTADDRIAYLKKYRTQMILSYFAAVTLITVAAALLINNS